MSFPGQHESRVEQDVAYGHMFIFLLFLAFAVRLGVWIAHYRHNTFIQPDTMSYLRAGIELLTSGTFPSFARTPVYPLFLASMSKFLSPNPAIMALVQIAVSLLTVWLMYGLWFRLFGSITALLVLAFMALDVTSAISANHLLTETFFTFLLSGCLVGLLHVRSRISIMVIGIGLSFLALCRPVAILLPVVVAFWLYVTLRKRGPNVFTFVSCFLACSILLPVSWIARNHAHTGVYFFSTISSTNLFQYRAAWNVSRVSDRTFDEMRAEFKQRADLEKANAGLNEGELARWKQSRGLKILREMPFLTLIQGLDGLVKMYLGISNASINEFSITSNTYELENSGSIIVRRLQSLGGRGASVWIAGIKIWAILYLLLLYSGVLYSVVGMARGRFTTDQRRALWLMLVVIAYFTLFSVGAEANSRFRVPIAPSLSVLGATGWVVLLRAGWK